MSDRYNSNIARFVGWLNGNPRWAVTISKDCTLYSVGQSEVGSGWAEHEHRHKLRIEKMGWLNFMATYLWQMLTKGYDKSELEQSAHKVN